MDSFSFPILYAFFENKLSGRAVVLSTLPLQSANEKRWWLSEICSAFQELVDSFSLAICCLDFRSSSGIFFFNKSLIIGQDWTNESNWGACSRSLTRNITGLLMMNGTHLMLHTFQHRKQIVFLIRCLSICVAPIRDPSFWNQPPSASWFLRPLSPELCIWSFWQPWQWAFQRWFFDSATA